VPLLLWCRTVVPEDFSALPCSLTYSWHCDSSF
jgi:hypothetical protein